ncbi:unnamed protein product [Arctogadus glacialis]
MSTSKRLRWVICVVLPLVGFALICVGVFQMFLGKGGRYVHLREVMAYAKVMAGLIIMLIPVIWAVCHSAKSRDLGPGDMLAPRASQQICTVDRPFPPSYEESQRRCMDPPSIEMVEEGAPDSMEMVVEGKGVPIAAMSPPLYTQHSSDIPDCTLELEQPPPYTGPAPTS